ncbi:HD domain-containing phosphohydrolase [Paucidesulfovibrio longus]|uniref:HD domain-containing phosphohydrolase n=1 Tax=Paucidesulfovibrio longus TaxID=889 RepID=UPI00138AC086|nr:HD domain-containing phosphohydrolase [Paucidesulfovibrio longus]
MDLISRAVVNHHVRVGYLAAQLAGDVGLSAEVQRDLLVAGLLHDAGALSLKSRLDALQFEHDGMAHAEAGYRLLRPYQRLRRVARYVRLHHTPYRELARNPDSPAEANILSLADRIDVLIERGAPLSIQIEHIRSRIQSQSGLALDPRLVEAFLDHRPGDAFWLGAEQPNKALCTPAPERLEQERLGVEEVLDLSRLFSQIIDFRSRFTATHSSGVAATAVALARLVGFGDREQLFMHIAGNLHDLGKLAVPAEVLDKPGALDDREWELMRDHALYTHQVLADLQGLESVAKWAGEHHERLDGKGYPFGLGKWDLSMGSRIVAVADVFTAVTEDRPYRNGMNRADALGVLEGLAASALDRGVVDMLWKNFDEINEIRHDAQFEAARLFAAFGAGKEAA